MASDTVVPLGGLLAVGALSWMAWRVANRLRLVFSALALGAACAVVGDIHWWVYEVALRREMPYPSLADAWYLAAYPFFLFAFGTLVTRSGRSVATVERVLDGLVLVTVATAVAWPWLIAPELYGYEAPALEKAVTLAYPLGDLTVAIVALLALFSAPRGERTPIALLALSPMFWLIGDIMFASAMFGEAYSSGNPADVAWFTAFLMLAVGALHPRAPSIQGSAALQTPESKWFYVPLGAALFMIPYSLWHVGTPDAWMIRSLAATALVAALVRAAVSFHDRAGLAGRLAHSEKRIGDVLRHTQDLVLRIGPDGRVRYVNATARRLLGLQPEGLEGRHLVEVVHPADVKAWRATQTDQGPDEGAGRPPVAMRIRAADGEWRHFETVTTAVAGDDGWVVNARDITDRHETERHLAQTRERLKAVIESAPFALWVVDENLEVKTVEGRLARTLGWATTPEQGRGRSALADRRLRALAQHTFEGHPGATRTQVGGRVLETRCTPALDPETRMRAVLAVTVDVTDQAHAEAAQKKLDEQAVELKAMKDLDTWRRRLLNTAAHQLSTPLTPLSLQVDLLEAEKLGSLTERQREAVGTLRRNVDWLERTVREILNAAQTSTTGVIVERRPTDLRHLIERTVMRYDKAAAARSLTLDVAPCPEMRAVVDGDRLADAIGHVVDNAIKFSPEGGTVRIRCGRAGDRYRIAVEDDGIGLDPASREEIFDPFTQAFDTHERVRSGTGLGLFLAKGVVEAHGGTIVAESGGPGQGARFTIEVPLDAQDDAGGAHPNDAAVPDEDREATVPPHVTPGKMTRPPDEGRTAPR